jgi:hypothetical protein
MRFRYIDGRGKEITLDSVEALAARIELGAVSATTELYDARTDSWGPAESHAVYSQVLEEAAARDYGDPSVAPTTSFPEPDFGPTDSMSATDGDTVSVADDPEPDSAGDTPPPTDPFSLDIKPDLLKAAPVAVTDLAPAVEAVPADPAPLGDDNLGIGGALELEAPSVDSATNDAALEREPPLEGFSARPEDPWNAGGSAAVTDGDLPEDDESFGGLVIDHEWGSGRYEGGDNPGEAARADAGLGEQATPSEMPTQRFSVDDPFEAPARPFDAEDPFAASTHEDTAWPDVAVHEDVDEPAGWTQVLSVLSSPPVQWGFLVGSFLVMALFGSVVASGLLLRGMLTVGGVLGLGVCTGLFLWRDPGRRSLIPAATFGLVTVLSVPLFLMAPRADAAEAPAPAARAAARASVEVPSGPVPEANAGEAAMEARALEEVVAGLDSLAISYGLDRRPAEWLQGVYLANASWFPQVQEYWERYQRYVDEIETQDADWFRSSYEARLRETGVAPSAIEGLVERGMSRFYASAGRRQELYNTMHELADGALELHTLLLEREADIDYEPYSQNGVSADPVVEAVPNDPELEDEMWAIIGSLALALEQITALGQTSPGALQRALADSIKASIR